MAASCEDGSEPVQVEPEVYECGDGSEPGCDDGSELAIARDGSKLLCTGSTAGAGGRSFESECLSSFPPGEGDEGPVEGGDAAPACTAVSEALEPDSETEP